MSSSIMCIPVSSAIMCFVFKEFSWLWSQLILRREQKCVPRVYETPLCAQSHAGRKLADFFAENNGAQTVCNSSATVCSVCEMFHVCVQLFRCTWHRPAWFLVK